MFDWLRRRMERRQGQSERAKLRVAPELKTTPIEIVREKYETETQIKALEVERQFLIDRRRREMEAGVRRRRDEEIRRSERQHEDWATSPLNPANPLNVVLISDSDGGPTKTYSTTGKNPEAYHAPKHQDHSYDYGHPKAEPVHSPTTHHDSSAVSTPSFDSSGPSGD